MQNFYPLFAYVLGAIPFGLILSQVFGNKDLRKTGSKNIGATNVFRTQGKILGAMTFLLDFFKGFIACYFLKTECNFLNLLIIVAPVVGHIFPIWLKFNGGKGIATYFGVLCALNPLVFYGTLAVWVSVFFITKVSAIAGITSAISSLAIFYYVMTSLCLDYASQLQALTGLVVMIILRHRENIKQLIKKNSSHATHS